MTLTEFLTARIDEDEAVSRETYVYAMTGERWKHYPEDAYYAMQAQALRYAERLSAECEAKRRIVEHCEPDVLALSPGDEYVLRILAAVYADHPDYDEAWRV